jgi:hypothetical protein
MGAGLGPATAFLYSGPAINALAIILTAKVLGVQLGLARAIGAVVFSVVIGLAMAWLFRKDEAEKVRKAAVMPEPDDAARPLWKTAAFFGLLVGILVFSNWGASESGFFALVYQAKWWITSLLSVLLAIALWRWFSLPARRVALWWPPCPPQPLWRCLTAPRGAC